MVQTYYLQIIPTVHGCIHIKKKSLRTTECIILSDVERAHISFSCLTSARFQFQTSSFLYLHQFHVLLNIYQAAKQFANPHLFFYTHWHSVLLYNNDSNDNNKRAALVPYNTSLAIRDLLKTLDLSITSRSTTG